MSMAWRLQGRPGKSSSFLQYHLQCRGPSASSTSIPFLSFRLYENHADSEVQCEAYTEKHTRGPRSELAFVGGAEREQRRPQQRRHQTRVVGWQTGHAAGLH